MPVLLIIGGLVLVYVLRQQAGTPALVQQQQAAQFSQQFQAIGTPQPIAVNSTDQAVTGGLATAAKMDPEPITRGILSLATSISSVFTAAHEAALKKEASTLNNVNPTFLNEVVQTMAALNRGEISEGQAVGYLQQAQADYYTTVEGIIRGRWPYQGSQFPEPTWADSYENRGGPFGSSSKNPDSHAPDPCNAACVLGHYQVERAVVGLTKIIQAGGGSMTIEAFPTNGLIKGTPAVIVGYSRPGNTASIAVQNLFQRLGL